MKGDRSRFKKLCLTAFTGMLCFIFLVHFTFVILYIIPFNPIMAKHHHTIHQYMEPLFTQKWELFAPDPISDNRTVYMQVQFDNQEKSDWIDISSSLIQMNQSNPLSPYNRLVRIPTTGAIQAFQQDKIINQLMEKTEESEDKQHMYESLVEASDDQRQDGVNVLYRYAYSEAQRLFHPDDIDQVQLRMIIEDSVPFSERLNRDTYEVERFYVDFDWQQYEHVSRAY